jgi:NADH-quinone oxidoreductase subunit J
MLDINMVRLREGFLQYLPLGALIGLIFVIELGLVIGAWAVTPEAASSIVNPAPIVAETTNTHALGQIVYTNYAYLFQAAGIVLLIAMIGAIVLTLRRRSDVRRQRIPEQIARKREDVIEVRDVPTGSGV